MKDVIVKLFIGLVFVANLTYNLFAAQFHLPNRTPGLQVGNIQKNINGNPVNCEHVTIPGTACVLYFPINGFQPTTEEAGQYSGARFVGQLGDDLVTDWWVRVFGGRQAVNLSYSFAYVDMENEVYMTGNHINGLNVNPVHIIQMSQGVPQGFEQQFWQTFRQIAADPVGRVLLYRLLIEIRRLDRPGGDGCCGDDADVIDFDDRNNCRTITIEYSDKSCSFSILKGIIRFFTGRIETFTFIQEILNGVNSLTTRAEQRDNSIGLFHEMLHWFHFLRNPDKLVNNLNADPENFKYTGRCYYGNISEICIWGGNTNVEEIATILGSPNYSLAYNNLINTEAFLNYNPGLGVSQVVINGHNRYIPNSDRFLNGDDLSENVYRTSRSQNGNSHHMRFGHVNQSIKSVTMNPIPNRFQLAHQVAVTCYDQITGNAPQNWNLVQGEAIQ